MEDINPTDLSQVAEQIFIQNPALKSIFDTIGKGPIDIALLTVTAFLSERMVKSVTDAERRFDVFAGAVLLKAIVDHHCGETGELKRRCETLERTIQMLEL
jgi:hypothetical protein